tara:strand:+ start:10787 stop:11248 length:462 start_codon:yes stop_codon:yes gene_type:complete
MGTRRLIAFKHEGGYDYVHLTYEGDNAPDVLDANWSTESAARELVTGGDIAVLAANDTERHNIPGRGVGSANDLEGLLCAMYGNEHLVSVFDQTGTLRDEIESWNAKMGFGWSMTIDNPDSTGSWIHLADSEEMFQRSIAADEIAEENARKAA